MNNGTIKQYDPWSIREHPAQPNQVYTRRESSGMYWMSAHLDIRWECFENPEVGSGHAMTTTRWEDRATFPPTKY